MVASNEVDNYLNLGQEENMKRDVYGNISNNIRSRWRSFKSLKAGLDKIIDTGRFFSTFIPVTLYARKTWGERRLS